jgi:hypothetical protein
MPEADLFLLFSRELNRLGIPYMVSGSVAVIIYGEPRLTHHLDLIVSLLGHQIDRLAEAFPAAQFYCPPPKVIRIEAGREERGHFNVIHHATGFKADFFLAGRDPLHRWAFPLVRRVELAGEPLVIAPPEYVIVRKLQYFAEGGSEKHLRDIRSMLAASAALIDSAELKRLIRKYRLESFWSQLQEG